MSELMTLKEICRRVGVTRRMVQGYEQKGLVSAVSTNKYGHLLYDGEGLRKIESIRLYQQFGFRLDEIRELFELSEEELKIRIIRQIEIMQMKRDEYDKLIQIAKEQLWERGDSYEKL